MRGDVVILPPTPLPIAYYRIVKLHQDGAGTFILLGDAPGDGDGFHKRDPAGLVIHEKYPSLGLVGVGYRCLCKDSKGVFYPLDEDDVVGRLLTGFLGHGEQRGLIQDTPP